VASKSPTETIVALTGLRGLAALWVVLYHVTGGIDLAIFNLGWLGVDVFFILSGFVLSLVYSDRRTFDSLRGYVEFLLIRLARIYPLHVFALILVGGLWLLLPVDGSQNLGGLPGRTIGGLLEALLLVQGWPWIVANDWNEPAWTLSAEWLAYIAFPGFLWASAQFRTPAPALAAAVLMPMLYWLLLWFNEYPVNNYINNLATPRMLFEFGAGCLVYRASTMMVSVPAITGTVAVTLIGAGLMVAPIRGMALVGFVFLVLAAARDCGWVARILRMAPLVNLGTISFSVYILHLIIRDLMKALLGIDGEVTPVWRIAWIIGFVSLVCLIGSISYRYIELPARQYGRRWAARLIGAMEPAFERTQMDRRQGG